MAIEYIDKNTCKMFDQLRKNWNIFKKSPPGKRFQNRYYRHAEKRNERSRPKRILIIFIGIVIILIGVVLWFIPGPGWATIFFGAGIIAGESLLVSRLLDAIEVKIRKFLKKHNILSGHQNAI